jgi:hypothetical protein
MIQLFTKSKLLFNLLIVIVLYGCSKGGSSDTKTATPVINSLSVNSGQAGTRVLIQGNNFNSTLLSTSVSFNGVPAKINSGTSTVIDVEVPLGAGTGPVVVYVNSKTVTGPTFTYEPTGVVSTISTNHGASGLGMDALGTLYTGNGSSIFTFSGGTFTDLINNVLPGRVTADAIGNAYFVDFLPKIYKVTPNGTLTKIAGDGVFGYKDGNADEARFGSPQGMAIDAAGNVYVADFFYHVIRKIGTDGTVSTYAGTGTLGANDGPKASASFTNPADVAIGPSGTLYVSDFSGPVIRSISQAGVVKTINAMAATSIANGHAMNIAVGPDESIYLIADAGNGASVIKKVNQAGKVTIIAGSGISGSEDGIGARASFKNANGIVVDSQGTIYVADQGNARIRKIILQ